MFRIRKVITVILLLSFAALIWDCQIEIFSNERIKDDVAKAKNKRTPDILVKHYFYSEQGIVIEYGSECSLTEIELSKKESLLIKFKIYNPGNSELNLADSGIALQIFKGSKNEVALSNLPDSNTIETNNNSYLSFYVRFQPENNKEKVVRMNIYNNVPGKNPYYFDLVLKAGDPQ